MTPASLPALLRRLWAQDTFVYSLRVCIALGTVMTLCWTQKRMELVMPVFLGIIACALAETDDNWRGRLRALLATLGCFAVAGFAVQWLFPRPLLFALALPLAAFCLTMLGAIGERYRAIAQGTLILALYAAIGTERPASGDTAAWREPVLLLSGAAWYGLLSVAWAALFAHQPVQQNLARLYQVLGDYLRLKSMLFEPVRGIDVERRRMALARHNGEVVQALNMAKESLFRRLGGAPPQRRVGRYLSLYFIAQDVHERASSSHEAYGELTDVFFHSDVMYRCQRLLALQGRACEDLAEAIRLRQPFEKRGGSLQAMADLRAALQYLRQQPAPQADGERWGRLLRSLQALADNLAALDTQLVSASHPPVRGAADDSSLFDRSPRTVRDALERVRVQFTPASALFRHALRLALALAAGFAVLHLIHMRQGYWILLTTLFVCRPNYGDTRLRMVQRVAGTIGGLLAGWALLQLFPSLLLQSVFAVVAGVAFFATRTTRYAFATGAITLLVLLGFNQAGNGYDLIVPRLVDTVAGALIAGAAVFLVLPDWQGRRLEKVAAQAVAASARYLQEIMSQYGSGKRDDLAYRLARRNAHNADAALSTALANMVQAPSFFYRGAEAGIRFLVQSHTLLNYLSALGAHRHALPGDAGQALVERAAAFVVGSLEDLALQLAAHQAPAAEDGEALGLAQALEQLPEESDETGRRMQIQLALICRMIGPLRNRAARLVTPPAAGAVPATADAR